MTAAPTARGHGDPPPPPERLPIPVADNHAHLDIDRDGDIGDQQGHEAVAAALAVAASVGVDRVVQIGCTVEAARYTLELLDTHPRLLGGIALHPNEAPRLAASGRLAAAYATIEELAAHPRIRVIGESGLDYYRTPPPGRGVQQDAFRWHIELAKRTGKALQIHDRDAHDDVLAVLESQGAPEKTVFHCFSGDIVMARHCVERGYHLSFAGTVTFKNASALRNALSVVPLEQVLVETDAPYLTPSPYRGAANAPYLVPLTVRVMAGVLGVAVPTLCEALSANAERLYGPW